MNNGSLTVNKYCALALVVFTMLVTACSDKTENENAEQAVEKPIVQKTYETSVLQEDLEWLTNNDAPVFASPDAKKGGVFRDYMLSFPLTLRTAGPDSNTGLFSYLRTSQPGLVELHPNTEELLPALATHWAYSEDLRTIYYKLNVKAQWSDGLPITADDYLYTLDFMRSEHIVSPWYNNHYTNEIVSVKKYDDYTISITGATERVGIELHYHNGIAPTPRHFHKLDENWVREYNWKVAPVPGAYSISKVEKGKYVEFSRNKNWWGSELKYYKNRFNVDTIRLSVIRDVETAYRHFLRQELDTHILTLPSFWHDKTSDDVYTKGYVNRIWFYNDVRQSPTGLYLNLDKEPFSDINVRKGFTHSINIEKMIDTVLRGDYLRLHNVTSGHGEYTDETIKAREFDLEKAEHYFSLAGWDERGPDGIRIKDDQRMSVNVVYSADVHTARLVVLKEEAKKAGVELQLNLVDSSARVKMMLEKKHQVAWAALSTGFRPQYWGMFHSENAHKAQTTNISNVDDTDLDEMIMAYRSSKKVSERKSLAKKIQNKIHDISSFVPSYQVPYVRHAYWPWIKLPEWHGTRTSEDLFSPVELSLFWIDEAEKERINQAMDSGETFEPSIIIDETYKVN